MLVHKHKARIQVTAGSGSENTLKFSGAQLVQVFMESATSTNIFDFALIDEDNDEIYTATAVEGYAEEHSVYIPLRGVYTISITDATIDEIIEIKLMVEE